MFVSTFELPVKRQFPKPEDLPMEVQIPDQLKAEIRKLSRTVIQGYFLTISNLNAFDVTLSCIHNSFQYSCGYQSACWFSRRRGD